MPYHSATDTMAVPMGFEPMLLDWQSRVLGLTERWDLNSGGERRSRTFTVSDGAFTVRWARHLLSLPLIFSHSLVILYHDFGVNVKCLMQIFAFYTKNLLRGEVSSIIWSNDLSSPFFHTHIGTIIVFPFDSGLSLLLPGLRFNFNPIHPVYLDCGSDCIKSFIGSQIFT